MKIKIAIYDNHTDQDVNIKANVEKYFSKQPEIETEIYSFDNSQQCLDKFDKIGGFDILLLNISALGIKEEEIASEIRKRKAPCEFIFISYSSDFAVEAFALEAVHYLLIPFSEADFNEALDRAMAKIWSAKCKKLPLRAEGRIRIVDTDEIIYIESHEHVLNVYLKNGCATESRRSLGRISEELEKIAPGQFISPYKGYVINQKAINAIETKRILMNGGISIPIPRGSYRTIQKAFLDFMFG